jgi:hypothetical protein
MADTFTIGGKTYPKTYAYAGGALVLGIVGYAWWRQGMVGAEESALVSPEGYDAFGNPLQPGSTPEYVGPTVRDSNVNVDDRVGFTTNEEWYLAAIDMLRDRFGVLEATVASAALNKYLDRKPLNASERAMIQNVVNSLGPPPVGGPYSILAEPPPPAATAPGPIVGLRVESTTATSIRIAWTAQTGMSYKVTRYGGGTATRTSPSHTSSGLKPGSEHAFFVRAVNSAGQEGPQSEIRGKTSGAPAAGIGAPSGLRVVSRNSKNTRIRIRWNPVPGAQKYYVSRGGGGHGVMVTRPEHVVSGPGRVNVRAGKGRRPDEVLSATSTINV